MNQNGLKINTLLGTVLGLITGGLYWAVYFTSWSKRHATQKLASYERLSDIDTGATQDRVKRASKRTVLLGRVTTVMLGIGVALFLFALLWEVVLDRGPTPILTASPDTETMFFCYLWLASAMLPITYGSLLFEIRYILAAERAEPITSHLTTVDELPLLTSGGGGAIVVTTIVHFVVALGVLPLLVFPPIIASSLNRYVSSQQRMWS